MSQHPPVLVTGSPPGSPTAKKTAVAPVSTGKLPRLDAAARGATDAPSAGSGQQLLPAEQHAAHTPQPPQPRSPTGSQSMTEITRGGGAGEELAALRSPSSPSSPPSRGGPRRDRQMEQTASQSLRQIDRGPLPTNYLGTGKQQQIAIGRPVSVSSGVVPVRKARRESIEKALEMYEDKNAGDHKRVLSVNTALEVDETGNSPNSPGRKSPAAKSEDGSPKNNTLGLKASQWKHKQQAKGRLRNGSQDDSFLPTIRERENSHTESCATPSSRDGKSSIFSSLDDSSVARDSQCAIFDYHDLEIDCFEDHGHQSSSSVKMVTRADMQRGDVRGAGSRATHAGTSGAGSATVGATGAIAATSSTSGAKGSSASSGVKVLTDFGSLSKSLAGILRRYGMDVPLELQKYIVPVICESLKIKRKRFVMIQGPPDSGKTSSLLVSLLAVYAFPDVTIGGVPGGSGAGLEGAAAAVQPRLGETDRQQQAIAGPVDGKSDQGKTTSAEEQGSKKSPPDGTSTTRTTAPAAAATSANPQSLPTAVSAADKGVAEYLAGHGALNTMVLVFGSMDLCRKLADFTFGRDQTTIAFVDGSGTPADHSNRFTDRHGPYYPRVLYGQPAAVLNLLRGNLNRSSNLRPSSGNGVDLRELECFVLDDAEKLISNDCMDDVCEILQICKFFSRKKLRFIILSGYIISNHFGGAKFGGGDSSFSHFAVGAGGSNKAAIAGAGATAAGGGAASSEPFGSGFWGSSGASAKTGGQSQNGLLNSLTANRGQKQHSSMLRSLRNSLIKGQNLFGLRKDQIRMRARRHVKHYAVVARRKRWAKLLADLHKTLSLPMGVIFFDQHQGSGLGGQGAGGESGGAAGGTAGAATGGAGASAGTAGGAASSSSQTGFPIAHQSSTAAAVVDGVAAALVEPLSRLSSKGSGGSSSSASRGFKSNAELIKKRAAATAKRSPAKVVGGVTGSGAVSRPSASGTSTPRGSTAGIAVNKNSSTSPGDGGKHDTKAETTSQGGGAASETDGGAVSSSPSKQSVALGQPAPSKRHKPKSAAERAREQRELEAKEKAAREAEEATRPPKPAEDIGQAISKSGSVAKAATESKVLRQQLSEVLYQEEMSLLEELLHGHSSELTIHPTLDARNVPGGCDFYLTPSNPIILRAEVPKGLRCVVHFGVLETHLYGLRLMALQVQNESGGGAGDKGEKFSSGKAKTKNKAKADSASKNNDMAISLLFLEPDEADQALREIEEELEIQIQVIPNELLPS